MYLEVFEQVTHAVILQKHKLKKEQNLSPTILMIEEPFKVIYEQG